MLNWYRINRIGAAGVLFCLFFGGIEILVLLASGVERADLNSPLGIVATHIAGYFTEPASLLRAGSVRRSLVYQLVLGAQIVLVPLCAVLLWWRTRLGATARAGSRLAATLLAAQIALCSVSVSSMIYVLAAELAVVLPLRRGLAWLGGQLVATAIVAAGMALIYQSAIHDDTLGLFLMYTFFGMLIQAIVFGVGHLAVRERAARLHLAATNARLLATQSMLADTVRASERMRIARDLHDAVGHHLTALNLHLDLAVRQSADNAPPALRMSRELASSLLTEVRSVVSSERRERIDLRAAIGALCQGIPHPPISVHFDDGVVIESPLVAHTVFFCVQEAITNTVRHAGATHLQIAVRSDGGQLLLAMEDDGRGAPDAAEGNGLRGMRERVAAQDGTLTAGPGHTRGYRLAIALPLAGSAA